jgi:hypothetical protein
MGLKRTQDDILTGDIRCALAVLAQRHGSVRRALYVAVERLLNDELGRRLPDIVSGAHLDIVLTKGYRTIVDVEDYDRLVQMATWQALERDHTVYASGIDRASGKAALMHRVLLDCPDGMVVDHINGNGLDNRKQNLRICTNMENLHNSRPMRGCRYKGVWKLKGYDLWYAVVNHKRVGSFRSEREAALAYNRAAKQEYGEFAYLNKVEES